MNAPALIAAITAAAAFAESEEPGVQIVAARSADLVDRWFVVEGRRKSSPSAKRRWNPSSSK